MSKISLLLVGALLIGGSAYAETTDDTTLAAPGCYNGTGCDQNGWEVSTNTADNTELGLNAVIRNVGAPGEGTNIGSISGNTYTIPAGGEDATHALWDFSWSINTNLAGTDTQPISDFSYLLTITDTTTGHSTSFDPTNPLLGDATQGDWGAQNAESPSFGFLAVPLAFNDNAPDDYVITMTESLTGVGQVNSDTINVDVVTPEPSTISLAGLAICGLWFVRRRQMQRN